MRWYLLASHGHAEKCPCARDRSLNNHELFSDTTQCDCGHHSPTGSSVDCHFQVLLSAVGPIEPMHDSFEKFNGD